MIGFEHDLIQIHNDRLSLYSHIHETSPYSFYKDEKYIFTESYAAWDEYLTRLSNGTLEEDIANFNGTEIPISIKDYKDSDYYNETSDRGKRYKVEKMLDVIRSDPYYYALYLSKLIGPSTTFFFADRDVSDDNRVRLNNFNEIEDTSLREEFIEPHRLYVIRKDNNYTKLIFYINGRNVVPKIYTDDKYNYVYIPFSEIPDSFYSANIYYLLEIEKIYDHRYTYTIDTEDSDITTNVTIDDVMYDGVEISIPKDSEITPRDIYIAMDNIDGDSIYIPRVWIKEDNTEVILYRLLEKRNDDKIVDVSTPYTDFMTYNDIIFVPMLELTEYIVTKNITDNRHINIYMDRINITQHVKGDNGFNYHGRLNPDIRNLQIFKNGLLIPDRAYEIYFNESSIIGPHSFKAAVKANPDDVFTFTYSKHKRVKVYSRDLIPENGYLDLDGILTKPFSLKWYDVYINGLKLDITHIRILSPFKILIRDFESRKNLVIYQKNLDLGDMSKPIHVDGQTLFSNPQDDWIKKYDWVQNALINGNVITDKLPNIIEDIVANIFGFLKEYLGTRWGLLNPDIQQITSEMIVKYPSVFDMTTDVYVNPDENKDDYDRDYFMDPDTKQDIVNP